MKESCSIPVTVKHRIGVDDLDSHDDMKHLLRVCPLPKPIGFLFTQEGMAKDSARENRNIPPLRYEEVYQLKKAPRAEH